MALQMLYLSALFSSVLLVLIVQKTRKKPKKTDSTYNIPPGPRKHLVIGNIYSLVGSLPHRKLREVARKYGPLMHIQLAKFQLLSFHYSSVLGMSLKAMTLTAIISYGFTNIAFAPYGNCWRQLQNICTLELLSLKHVNSFQPIR